MRSMSYLIIGVLLGLKIKYFKECHNHPKKSTGETLCLREHSEFQVTQQMSKLFTDKQSFFRKQQDISHNKMLIYQIGICKICTFYKRLLKKSQKSAATPFGVATMLVLLNKPLQCKYGQNNSYLVKPIMSEFYFFVQLKYMMRPRNFANGLGWIYSRLGMNCRIIVVL